MPIRVDGELKSIFSKGTYARIRQEMERDIISSAESNPVLRHEISRVFQVANRRIQNIETKGVKSPAVMALGLDTDSYTKFSMRQSWADLKRDYAKAIGFLRQPTSTLTGLKEYNNHIKSTYGLTDDEFNLMSANLYDRLTSVNDQNFVERYLMRYKDFTGELETAAADVSGQIESAAESIQNAIDKSIESASYLASAEVSSDKETIQQILDELNSFEI